MDPPPRPSSLSHSRSKSPSNDRSDTETPPQPTLKQRAEIKTHHCRFCSHLLLATTQDLSALPRRREPAADRAIILPLPEGEEEDEEDEEDGDEDEDGVERTGGEESATASKGKEKETQKQPSESESQAQKRLRLLRKHYTILLSTTLPDRKHTVIRREDGFEKRLLLRCGRCRVVVGYVLDEEAHGLQPASAKSKKAGGDGDGEGDAEQKGKEEGRTKVVYILPGSLVGTEEMGSEVKVEKEEWAKWIKS